MSQSTLIHNPAPFPDFVRLSGEPINLRSFAQQLLTRFDGDGPQSLLVRTMSIFEGQLWRYINLFLMHESRNGLVKGLEVFAAWCDEWLTEVHAHAFASIGRSDRPINYTYEKHAELKVLFKTFVVIVNPIRTPRDALRLLEQLLDVQAQTYKIANTISEAFGLELKSKKHSPTKPELVKAAASAVSQAFVRYNSIEFGKDPVADFHHECQKFSENLHAANRALGSNTHLASTEKEREACEALWLAMAALLPCLKLARTKPSQYGVLFRGVVDNHLLWDRVNVILHGNSLGLRSLCHSAFAVAARQRAALSPRVLRL